MADFSTQAKRAKLKPGIYWQRISAQLSLGYRKGGRSSRWWAREYIGLPDGKRKGKVYRKKSLAEVSNRNQKSDGAAVLNHDQAIQASIEWCSKPVERSTSTLTIGHVVDAYLRHYEASSKDATRSNAVIAGKWINADLRKVRMADITTYRLQVWFDDLVLEGGVSEASANRIRTVLLAALNYGYDKMGVHDPDRWRRIKPHRGVNKPKAEYLSAEDAIALTDAMPADFRALALGALYTGGRYGELTKMQVDHVDTQRSQVEFIFTKSGKRRTVPLSDEGTAHFSGLIEGLSADDMVFRKSDGDAWGKSQQLRRMRAASKKARFAKPINFHQLRHSYASLLTQSGMSLRSIQHLLGHSDQRITVQHYAHIKPDHVAEEVRSHLPSFTAEKDDAQAG